MKLLICGDSFAADWTVKYSGRGWPNMLADFFDVTNLAQAGCSEYKIYLQLISADLSAYDKIIVSHTSPYRIYTKEHPVHKNDPLHKNSDLIYTDLKEHSKTVKGLEHVIGYFEEHFDLEYALFVHNLICEKIDNLTKDYDVIHLSNMVWDDCYKFEDMLQSNQLFKDHRGLMNHYDDEANEIFFNEVMKRIKDKA